MRTAIVSDIHGNLSAFEAVLADLRLTSPDVILHGGDLAANGSHPAEVIDLIRDLRWLGVRGNTDEMLWNPRVLTTLSTQSPKLIKILTAFQEMIPTTCEWLGEDRIRWLQAVPRFQLHLPIGLVHASPNDLWRAPMPGASDIELRNVYGELEVPVAIYAHIHRPYVRKLPGLTVANTGSVSLSYDGDHRPSYLLVEGTDVTIRRVEYDVEREISDLLNSGLPRATWLCQILRSAQFQHPA